MTRPILAAALALVATAATANAVVLYDGSLGTSPTSQGLTYSQLALAGGPFFSFDATGTTLNTNATTPVFAGFGTNAVTLDRAAGFTLRVDARIVSESHAGNNDRAGFSLLLVSSDLKAIELAFHTNEIFAQATVTAAASRGETVLFDTSAALTQYDVAVLGDDYTLRANGTPILTGALRNYTDFGGPPYTTPNALFLGDDTSSAMGVTRFTYVSVPEPATLGAIAGAGVAMLRRRRA